MKLSQFNYHFNEKLTALTPSPNRDESRLLVLHKKTGQIEHKIFKDIVSYFKDGDLFVFNDTKVFPARLYGNKEKTGAKIDVFLLRELNKDQRLWDVLVDPARKIRIGNKLYFGKDDMLVAEVIDNTTSRGRTVRFLFDGNEKEFRKNLFALGETPLPKTINRDVTSEDAIRYQTIYAKNEGAVVAPASGFHFSRELMKRMEIIGIQKVFLTLHIGMGVFRNVEVEDLTKHKPDSEQFEVSEETAEKINQFIQKEARICAVGTSVIKTLESLVTTPGIIKHQKGWTNKFIFPPYPFSVANSMISNFHFPKSTLLMIVAAFGGYNNVMKAYDIAVKEEYRFGAYGDAMLII